MPTVSQLQQEAMAAMLSPTKLDRAIAQVFPRWAAGRIRARREFAYEASRNTRLRQTAQAQLAGPEDYTAFPDRLALIRQVRDLEQNFGLFQSIIDKLALYAFGRIRYQSRTEDEAIDAQYEDYLAECFDQCDLSGRHDLQQLTSIAFKSQIRDGDFGEKWARHDGMLKITGIESDRIGGNVVVGGNDYFQGITVDLDTGRPLNYAVYQRTKANSYTNPVDVPAADMMLLADYRRYDQYRSITPFAPIVNEARDLKEVLEACLIGTKFENYHAAIGYTPSGQPLSSPSDLIDSSGTMANGNTYKEQQIKYGMIQWAPSDAEIDFIKSDRPGANFQTYTEMLVRLQGIALNLPYSFIYAMLGTGPAVRADLQAAHRVIEWHQNNVTKRSLNPIKNTYLMDGIAAGRIPYHPKWFNGKWQFAPAVSIDAGRDSAARVQEWGAGLRTKDSIYGEDGEDAQEQEAIRGHEVARTIKQAKGIAKAEGIDVNTVLTMLEIHTANGFLIQTPSDQLSKEQGGDMEDDDDAGEAEQKPTAPPSDMAKRGQVRELMKKYSRWEKNHAN
jgi:capsid protein